MTDSQIAQAISLKDKRDKAFALANKVYNYGIFQLEREELRVILNEVSHEDMTKIKQILTDTMNQVGQKYSEALQNL